MSDVNAALSVGRVVLLGGSIAGLATAAALAPHVAEVIVIERDRLPEGPAHRRGVPQDLHPHFILNAGRSAFEEMLPGFTDDVVAGGGEVLNPALDAAYLEPKGWSPRKSSPLTMLFTSRIQLESVLRTRVRALANVRFHEQTDVTGLVFDPTSGRVTGAHVTDRSGPVAIDGVVVGDLVVDAQGRASRVAAWLKQQTGRAIPTMDLNAKVMYSTRWYRRPPGSEQLWWKQLVIGPADGDGSSPHAEFLSTIYPVDGDRWIAFMGSWGHPLPSTSQDFEATARKLRSPVFWQALEQAEPLSEVHTTRSTHNRWIRYDRVAPPAGLVAVGDAVCAFNPLYGQGMSAAARSATCLRDAALEHGGFDGDFADSYFRKHAAFLQMPWSLATMRDKSYAHATGSEAMSDGPTRRLLRRIVLPAFELITAAAKEEPLVEDSFTRVFNLEAHASIMARPEFVWALARFKLRQLLGRSTMPEPADAAYPPPATDYSSAASRADRSSAQAASGAVVR